MAVLLGLFVEVEFLGVWEDGPVVLDVADDVVGVDVVVVFDAGVVDVVFDAGVDVVFDAGVVFGVVVSGAGVDVVFVVGVVGVVFGAGVVIFDACVVVVFGAGVDVVLVVGVFAVAPCVICCGADDNL